MVLVYKKLLTLMIDVYNGINVSILVKLIEIKIDMPDIITLVYRNISCRQENNPQVSSSVDTNVESYILLVTDKLIRSYDVEP